MEKVAPDQPRYWFKARRYGWGWRPATWQAWTLLAAYLIINVVAAVMLLPTTKDQAASFIKVVAFVLIFLSATFLLIGISLLKGEAPRWNWGDKRK